MINRQNWACLYNSLMRFSPEMMQGFRDLQPVTQHFLWERVSSWLFCRKRVTCKILPFVSSWSTTNFIAFEPRNGDGLVVYAHPLPSSHPPPRLLCNGMLRRLLPSLLPSHPGAELLRSPRAHSSRSSLCRGVHWLCRTAGASTTRAGDMVEGRKRQPAASVASARYAGRASRFFRGR